MNIKPNFESSSQDKDNVEQQVNFELNDTELLLSRLRDPAIKRQMVDAQYEAEMVRYRFFREEEWRPYESEDQSGESKFDLLEGVESGDIIAREDLKELLDESKPARQDIVEQLEMRIDDVANNTDIEYSSKSPAAGEAMPLEWKLPWTEEEPTAKQMSIIEAHEKGHEIRHYDELTDKLLRGFDPSNIEITEEYMQALKFNRQQQPEGEFEEEGAEELSKEEIRQENLENYLFTGDEIVERMSQLKNYFGMDGSDTFTKEHLHYAKENYIEDTGMDNAMSLFFQGITEETEDNFIKLINSMGV